MSSSVTPEAGQVTLHEITERLGWLTDLRWLAVAGVVALPVLATVILEAELPLPWLTLTGVAIAAYNVAFRAWLKRTRNRMTVRLAHIMANAQIGLDLAALTLVLHLSGGVDSPLWVYYVFHIIIAATMLSTAAAYAQATSAVVLFGLCVFAESRGIVHHYRIPFFAVPELYRSPQAWLVVAVLASVLYISAYLACSISERLRQRERELERISQEAQQQASQCQVAYQQLAELQKSQVSYMRKMAHEIKAPFAAIATALSVILDGLVAQDPEKQREILERARRRAHDGIAMANDLLDLARLRQLPTTEFAPVNLVHLINHVADMFLEQAAVKNIELRIEVADNLPQVWGDADAIETMLANLVSNAVKYTPEGGRVTVSAAPEPDGVVVRVSDTGLGIPEQDIPRLFEEFFRTAEARRSGIDGTGLGLAIVKSVVDRHGGTIDVDSRVGEGTTFMVRLPLAPPPDES
ncbi:MAG: HAMP domain-containing histidine kinase [Armatimonadetes bacterium]|nr:HAMP domain-containing histidine kinase [Armatimonadota bacterium]